MRSSIGSPAGWPSSNSAWPVWAADPAPPLDRFDPALIAGIAAYRRHPACRDLPDPPAIWREGDSRLLDYGGGSDAPTVLFVPSLINRAHILDLRAGHSCLRWLATAGLRPVLLDWGWPGAIERRFTLSDYVAGRLDRALDALGGRVVLAGYCMGGLLAIAAAQRRPDRVRALALLATPWDFHRPDPAAAHALAAKLPGFEPALRFADALPIDALQSLFSSLDPDGILQKYRAFGRLPQEGERARLFVAIEDWLNDGVPLAAPVARECLAGWYGRNDPATGAWRIADRVVDPTRLDLPSLIAVPDRDRVVPPDSALPLAELIHGAALLRPGSGHVGMVAGARAQAALWEPLLHWVQGLPAPA